MIQTGAVARKPDVSESDGTSHLRRARAELEVSACLDRPCESECCGHARRTHAGRISRSRRVNIISTTSYSILGSGPPWAEALRPIFQSGDLACSDSLNSTRSTISCLPARMFSIRHLCHWSGLPRRSKARLRPSRRRLGTTCPAPVVRVSSVSVARTVCGSTQRRCRRASACRC